MTKLSNIEGIGPIYAAKLEAAGLTSEENLLEICCDKKGRKDIAEKSGISEKMLLVWVKAQDGCYPICLNVQEWIPCLN